MKVTYRGCEIESVRELSCGGWTEVYWSAFSADGYELNSGFGGGSVREMFRSMKGNVDLFIDQCDSDTEKWEAMTKL